MGLNSQSVRLEFYSRENLANPRVVWRSHYSAYCAVNIKNAIDEYCQDWKDDGADNPKFNTYGNADAVVYYFGFYMPVTKFPMVNLQVTWSDGVQAIDRSDPQQRVGYRFRGWDVCLRQNDTRLCAATGDGT